ncbi:FKBP-type peptidyl-prolyl cis-trans isomerase [Alkalisalibacterium limincola]|uniref:Peptidyl-prolyl cis-trans isomerase n=1 Tax=Alkalisalibacterium limincola TaxID=2699169 RepID=A0A5C8KZU6_9GAMM|nr:peptidylprolyl isomerase [Alkalisalibacterium limincola]TXK65972.1 peptidylprolyl isomerase [Alkalisalibacterium limincola]
MKIENNCVVRFHYSVAEPGQAPTESSFDREPMAVLVGKQQVIAGLEEAMMDREAGDRFQVTVEPDKAYGERREGQVQRLPKKYFGDRRMAPGDQVVLQTKFGPRAVTVMKVGMSVVDVDLNHPMAGKTLEFDVEIVQVREASKEELEHGHAHGEGGVEH